ncbi:hypothetical protein SNE40_020035 [Patella caerulea]|uniref:Endonuclease/exonuclease/phosphatase domain-containing protein n=1 Tax=Patella caerulea TaxID=87958 RepID=A0AAN8GA54_PATCE
MINGDLNARTGNLSDLTSTHEDKYLPIGDLILGDDDFDTLRLSKDVNMNSFGKQLISMGKKLNIHILNGRLKGDNQGEYTFVSHLGKSVIDYCITSSLLFQYVTDFSVLSTDISDHFPIECIFNVCKSYKKSDIARECLNPKLTYKWDQNKATDFRVALQEIVTNGELSHFYFVVENSVNVNDATKILCLSIQYAGKCMLRNNKSKNTNCQPIWWTRELGIV